MNFAIKFGDSGKILMLENLGNFYAADSFGPLTKAEECLNFGHSGKIVTVEKKWGSFWDFFLPDNL
jgi:hypothetical protein